MTYFETTIIFPAVLLLLALGAGLTVDHVIGRWLPAPLIPVIGLAALVAAGQLATTTKLTAPTTPVLFGGLAAAGFTLQFGRLCTTKWPRSQLVLVGTITGSYLLAIAPVLLAGRPSLTSYLTDTTTGTHLAGADYLLHNGRRFSGLDNSSSYGLYIRAYFEASNYPSGAHVLLAGSGQFMPVRLTWLYQPFMASLLALCAPSALDLLRGRGLRNSPLVAASVATTAPSLVYAFTLVGSIKEISALVFILGTGVLAVRCGARVLGARGGLPLGLLIGAGVSCLGVPFAAWGLASAAIVIGHWLLIRSSPGRRWVLVRTAGTVVIVALVSAPATVAGLGTSFDSAKGIATTSDPGNLLAPLARQQLLGVWIGPQYRTPPAQVGLTNALAGIVALAAALGLIALVRSREFALLGWIGLLLIIWWRLTAAGTTWTDAKLLVLTAPVVALLAWTSVSNLTAERQNWVSIPVGAVILLGILYSAAEQYHGTNLAPTRRFDELATINSKFAGKGHAFLADFDEFSLYELRDIAPSGPGFAFKPASVARVSAPYGSSVDIDAVPPRALTGQSLIILRRSPAASRPPSNYELRWSGDYYTVWAKKQRSARILDHLGYYSSLSAVGKPACREVRNAAHMARRAGGQLLFASRTPTVSFEAAAAAHSPGWGVSSTLSLYTPGQLHRRILISESGRHAVWLRGQVGRNLAVLIDGKLVGSVGKQTGGVPNYLTPVVTDLRAGHHRLTIRRGGGSLAPGDGTPSSLDGVIVAPYPRGERSRIGAVSPDRYRDLCSRSDVDWIEAVSR